MGEKLNNQKKLENQEKSSSLSRKILLFGGIGLLAATTIGYALLPSKPNKTNTKSNSPITKQSESNILTAKTLGGVRVEDSKGQGKPIIYLAQAHGSELTKGAYAPKVQTNIEEVIHAAQDAYDNYGIHALYVEGITQQWYEYFKKTGTLRTQKNRNDQYRIGLEQLLRSRNWNFYPESAETLQKAREAGKPVYELYNHYWQKIQRMLAKENVWLKTHPEDREKVIKKANKIRDQYQAEINKLYKVHEQTIWYTLTTGREKDLFETVQRALQKEKGILVVYGGKHADGVQQCAIDASAAFMLIRSKELEERIKQAFADPGDTNTYILPAINTIK